MAIDGVKIIDSDDGYDIYNSIVERYKDGENIDKIIDDILKDETNYCTNTFYTEIYWTAVAYSLWKVGHLPEEIKEKALKIIAKGVDKFWLEIDSKAQAGRQKVLDKLAVKFENEYGIIFVSDIDQTPRKLEYHLACTRLLQKDKPTMDDFLNSRIACKKNNTKYAIDTDC